MRFVVKIFILNIITYPLYGQTLLTPDDAIRAALQNHPSVQAAALTVRSVQQSERAALNLPNPEINAESPTGEFYAIGVMQSFEFPTVYVRQKQVAKATTELARAGQRISENDLRYTVRSLYLGAQVAAYQSDWWRQRDSLYQQLAAAAARQFEGGEIDFLQKTRVENEAGKVRQEYRAAQQAATISRQQLALYIGTPGTNDLLPLRPDELAGMQPLPQANPMVAYGNQAVQVAERQADLAKSRALPNFSLGYLNQGARTTPFDYRFRASVGIPIWAGQYRAGKAAAQSAAQAAQSRAAAQAQTVALQLQQTQANAASALARVQYSQTEALPRSRTLLSTALRLREAGQIDYTVFLRTLDEAYDIQRDYAEQIAALNRAFIEMRYLSGQ